MDVQVDGNRIRLEREKRAWSQEHLAGAAGIGARTVQRIEATGVASYESLRAMAAALEVPVAALRVDTGRPSLRTSAAARWLGAALALVIVAGVGGFFLLKDYQQVRVLRTVESWVTTAPEASADSR